MQLPLLEIKRKKLFVLVAKSRLKWFFLFAILSVTPLLHRTMYLFGLWLGYGAGSLLTLLIVQYKAFGMLVFLAAVMPQALFLVPGCFGMMHWILKIRAPSLSYYKQSGLRNIRKFLIFFVMILIGMFLECYVNPFVMNIFIKIFL